MKQILMALAITTLTYCSADAQTKKATEKCTVSADGKTVTCCKTTANPACKMDGKTAVVAKKPVVKTIKTTQTNRYQVCKEHGGSYTCCEYKHTKPVVTTTTVAKADK